MLLVAAATFIDGLAGVGLFFSGLLIVSVTTYQYTQNLLSLPTLAFCVFFGAVLTDNVSFILGRNAKIHGKKLPFKPERIDSYYRFMERLGGYDVFAIIFGRSFSITRSIVPFMVGFSGTSQMRFLIVSIISAILWVGAWALILKFGFGLVPS